MPKVEESIRVHGLEALRVDVDISADGPDGEEALEWVEHLEDAVSEAVDEKGGDDGYI